MPKQNKNHLIKLISNSLYDLPTPSNISYIWNWGSLLGIIIIIQIITGLFLSIHYTANIEIAFFSVSEISRDIWIGNIIRLIHINGASIFFIFIYLHIGRNIIFSSYKITDTWIRGTSILFIIIATAFVGYVLPWGQISFWGTTVITNLISVIPLIGEKIVKWVWGDFSVRNPTLNRFFSIHFILPFIIRALIIIHLIRLHSYGSSNPSSSIINLDKIQFHPIFTSKDTISFIITILFIIILCLIKPIIFIDPENFNLANPLVSPIHIQPEWYFLFAYAILRAIPNKIGGVIALIISILTLYPISIFKKNISSKKFLPFKKTSIFIFFSLFIILTWVGANPVEPPFISTGQILRTSYFILIIIII
jgi:ubiquinol-cytochrome c reductase cytochrome b subunit